MIKQLLLTAFAGLLLFSSCTKSDATDGQHAVVLMRDGTHFSGTVFLSSSKEIQLLGDDKISQTTPMTQVRGIECDDAEPNIATAPPSAEPARSTPPTPAAAPRRPTRSLVHEHPTENQVTTKTHALPSGTEISVRVEETIDSDKAVEGQFFPSDVTDDVLDQNGDVVIPRGSNAEIILRSVSKRGKIKGQSDLVMDLASVSVEGRRYDLSTSDLEQRGNSGVGANRRTGIFTGGGAAVGAIIGAIAGGGKGAAIGAGSGAGAGALTQILTRGKIKVPVESVLTLNLDTPLRVTAAR